MNRVTVFDVAAEAGVSVATVDRVLNSRGGVRAVTIERVQGAIARLGFRRDAFAAGLATRRVERYAFVIPEGPNSFMTALRASVASVAEAVVEQRVELGVVGYRALDEASLVAALASLEGKACHGVALVGIDSLAVQRQIDRLVASGVAVVTLVSDVTPSRRQAFIGADNKAAGRVAAALLGRMTYACPGSVAMVMGHMTLHDHVERRLGFEQVLRRDHPHLRLAGVIEGFDDSERTRPLLAAMLATHPDIVGIYSVGAGNRGVIAAIRQAGPVPVTIAHELSAHAREALLDGIFTVVLDQDRDQAAAEALAALRTLIRGEAAHPPDVRTQIYLRENLP